MANYAIILAAGNGRRLRKTKPKCFVLINKKPIYQFCLETFQSISDISKIVLVVPPKYINNIQLSNKKVILVKGGKTRNESFEKAMEILNKIKSNDKIIIHDAARINVKSFDIMKLIQSKKSFGTLCYKGKPNDSDLRINDFNIQTPQFCLYKIYKNATKNSKGKDLFTYLNLKYKNNNFILSSNKQDNKKITFPKDIQWAKSI